MSRFFLLLTSFLSSAMVFAQPFAAKSVLSEGLFYKVALVESGIYKIDHAFLESIGANPSDIDPSQLKMFGQPPGILPQANSDPAPDDLQETAIALHGMEDGRFDEDDYLLFYAQSPHLVKPVPELASFFVEPHLYSDTAYYFLQLDGDEGKRVAFQEAENTAFPDTLTAANDFVYLKDERRNLLFSGRHWVGQDFSDEQNLSKTFGFPDITLDSGSVLSLQASFVSTSGSKTELQFSINDAVAGNLSLPRVRRFAYGQQGTARLGDFTLSATDLPSTEGLSLTIDNLTGEGGGVYLEFFTVTFQRTLQRTAPCQHIRSFASLYRGGVMYQLANATGTAVWDITDPWASREVELFTAGDTVFFHDEPEGKLHAFAWFAPEDVPTPLRGAPIQNQNLHGMASPELLIISAPEFLGEANRLAALRREHDRLSVEVVTPQAVYNEFSGGKQDVTAIRNFIRSLYLKGGLRYVLMFGDASYDFKNRMASPEANTNFVPVYESRNSLHNVHSYASDDYYTFMEDWEGAWPESGGDLSDHTMDIGIGRLPVRNLEEATAVVDKLLHYATASTKGDWRTYVDFFADDGDDNKHQLQSDFLADFVEDSFPTFHANRFFMDRYPQEQLSSGRERSPIMRELLQQEINDGALIIDFIGHGAETAWTDEFIFTPNTITELENLNTLPLFLTATCEFGRFDDWRRQSGAEELVNSSIGGAIGMLTTTRPVFFTTNFELSSAFYQNVFRKIDGEWPRLGDVFRLTKNQAISDLINRNFSLLGDPSMRLAYPEVEALVTRTYGGPIIETDSLDWQEVTFEGAIQESGNTLPTFNGELQFRVYDAPTAITTLGNEGSESIMTFHNRENVIQRGIGEVSEGKFQFSALLPRTFIDSAGLGKVSIYAFDESRDAAGSLSSIQVSDTVLQLTDTDPPQITFAVNGDALPNEGKILLGNSLHIQLFDESGIQLWQADSAVLRAVLIGDREVPIILSDFFQPDPSTYKSGSIPLGLENLTLGRFSIIVSAVDFAGNATSQRLDFHMVDNLLLLVYPNPLPHGETGYFRLSLPSSAEPYQIAVYLYDAQGKLMLQEMRELPSSAGPDVDISLSPSTQSGNPPGLYFYRVDVSTADYQHTYRGKWLWER